MRSLSVISLVAALAFGSSFAVNAEETVLVNNGVAVTTVSEDDLKDIFLGKKTTWDDGSKVVVVVLKEGPSSDALMKRLNKSAQQFITGWKKLVFSGKGSMPEQVDNEDELVAAVAKTPGAIGYADKGKLKDGVKAVALK
jgi:ABC-type phosphate transport system substrate-binding protein